MTPRQIQALRKRHLEQMQREELLYAQLNCSVINFSFGAPKKPAKPELFMLHPLKQEELEDPNATAGDRLLAQLQALPAGAAVRAN